MTNKKILTGLSFGKLVVIRQAPTHKTPGGTKITQWECVCVCGKIVIVGSQKLRKGHTKSCGCWTNNFISEANTKHGMKGSGTYTSWSAMVQRCTNPNNPNWKHYGGRGITVCDEWLNFEIFYEDMGERPVGLKLDRKDNEKGYYKENCQWATQTEQVRNRRNRKEFTVHGFTGSVSELGLKFGIDSSVIKSRLSRDWDVEKAFITPLC